MAETTPEPEPEQQLESDSNPEQEDGSQTESQSEDGEIINDRYLPRPLTMYQLFVSWENQINHGKLQMDERDIMTDRRIVPFNAHFAYPTLYPLIRIDYYTQSTYQLNESYLFRFRKLLLIRDLLDIPLDKRDGIVSEGGETRFLQLWVEGSEDDKLHKSLEDRWYYARELKDQANVIPSEEALRFPFLKHYLDQGKKDENERCWDLDLKRVNMWDERFRI
ncbi:hypothetical protein V866_000042 [Kwoniella sp. B9012]|uniref:Uncharacterized protein n=1 Tax=Kwoniella europaea PYCC6329 TaxID=1423913 RepID=A0AAX4K8P3_9TREE